MARKRKAKAKPQKVDAKDARILELIRLLVDAEERIHGLHGDIARLSAAQGRGYVHAGGFYAPPATGSKPLRQEVDRGPEVASYPPPPPATYQPFPQWHTTAYRTTHGQG